MGEIDSVMDTGIGESVEETTRAIRPIGYVVMCAAFTHFAILVMLITTAVT